MDIYEAYSFLFVDSFMSALILPIQTNLVFPVMLLFGGYNVFLMVIIATFSSIVAAAANWWLGWLIIVASKYRPEDKKALQFINFCRNKGMWILLLSWVPILGSVLIVIMGAVRVRLIKLLTIVFVVNLVYYFVLVLS